MVAVGMPEEIHSFTCVTDEKHTSVPAIESRPELGLGDPVVVSRFDLNSKP